VIGRQEIQNGLLLGGSSCHRNSKWLTFGRILLPIFTFVLNCLNCSYTILKIKVIMPCIKCISINIIMKKHIKFNAEKSKTEEAYIFNDSFEKFHDRMFNCI